MEMPWQATTKAVFLYPGAYQVLSVDFPPPMRPLILQSSCILHQERIGFDRRIWVVKLSFRPSNDTSKLSSHALIIGSGSIFFSESFTQDTANSWLTSGVSGFASLRVDSV